MAHNSPLVSVVVPVWNAAENLPRLLAALLGQSYKNLEIVAVDDGSSDDSLAILQDHAKRDARLKVLHQKNAGQSAARNAGIKKARGDFLMFVDADDLVVKDYVEKLVREIADEKATLAICGMRLNKLFAHEIEDVHLAPRNERRPNERLADYVIWLLIRDGRVHSSVNKIFRADVIRQNNLHFETGRDFAEDTKFVLDYLAHAKGAIKFVLEPLYIYNFGTESSTVKTSSTIWANWRQEYNDLKNWARKVSGGKLHLKTRMLLALVKLRWRVSHHRAKKRAQL